MIKAIKATLWVVRVTGVVQVVLGLMFWSGRQLALVPAHMAIGLAFVLGLWTLAALAARGRIGTVPVAVVALWGAFVLWLGMTQGSLLPGRMHWVVKVLHLAVGWAAMVFANVLAKRSTQRLRIPSLSHPRPSGSAEGSLTAS
ncbi:MAG TPA: hypothetical protein VFI52_07030 [Gemmatimonadaceae bacterium]|nr:hypothetical protein [Gemmatimonadaceae bacterium]